MKKLSDMDLKSEELTARLIEEVKTLKTETESIAKVHNNVWMCGIFQKPGHDIERCFYNTMDHNKKLKLPNGTIQVV